MSIGHPERSGVPRNEHCAVFGGRGAKFCEGALASRVKPALAQGSIMEFVLPFLI